jgi:predicted RND superfamily exporter protein
MFPSQARKTRRKRMTIVGVIIGLIVAIVFYVIATAVIVFAHSTLVLGLVALLIFLAFALGHAGFNGGRVA